MLLWPEYEARNAIKWSPAVHPNDFNDIDSWRRARKICSGMHATSFILRKSFALLACYPKSCLDANFRLFSFLVYLANIPMHAYVNDY